MIRKIVGSIIDGLSYIAIIALFFAIVDTIITLFNPVLNFIHILKPWDFFLRSVSVYTVYLFIVSIFGILFYFVFGKSRIFKTRSACLYDFVASTSLASLIIIIILDIPAQLGLSYYEPLFLILFFIGISVWFFLSIYALPLLFSSLRNISANGIPRFFRITRRLSLIAIIISIIIVLFLPKITHPKGDNTRPNLLIISIDTLRRDHVSYYGYDRITTENIDSFLRSGTCAVNAYTSSSWTQPSFASFLTGYNPSVCDVNLTKPLSPDITTLGEILRENGYTTECFNTNPIMFPDYGYGWGFDYYAFPDDIRALYAFRNTRLYRYTKYFNRAVRKKLGAVVSDEEFIGNEGAKALLSQGENPFFIWCHFIDPHSYYIPPEKYIPDYPKTPAEVAINYLRDSGKNGWHYEVENKTPLTMLYDGEINYVDEQVGVILSALKESGREDDTIVILFTDHGEEFWDHDMYGHGNNCYPESTEMVFGMRDPSLSSQVTVMEDYISHIGIMPTILEALGLPPLPGIQGESFYKGLSVPEGGQGPLLCEYMRTFDIEYKAIRKNGYFYVLNIGTGESEIYDIANDPGARFDLSGEHPDIEKELSADLAEIIEENEKLRTTFGDKAETKLSKGEVNRLKALGYIAD